MKTSLYKPRYMDFKDIEHNYEYDNEGINELGYVKIKMKFMYLKYFILFIIINSYLIYFMLSNHYL
jgi:hypothetical protein